MFLQVSFEPLSLLCLVRESGVEDGAVYEDEMDSTVVEALVEGAVVLHERLLVGLVHDVGWDRGVVLVSDVVVPGDVVDGRLDPAHYLVGYLRRGAVGG